MISIPLSAVAVVFPVLILVAALALLIVAATIWRRARRTRPRRSPLVRRLLRGPGESLRNELEKVTSEMETWLASAMVSPLVVVAIHLSQSHIGGTPETAVRIATSLVLGVGLTCYCVFRLSRTARTRDRLRQGLEGELAVGQELNMLMAHGYRVFHDLPAAGFNIDHVVVGPPGVFAVETKSRAKPVRGRGAEDARVVLDDGVLKFPGWTERRPLEQAVRQADWLRKWLRDACGAPIPVQPALALPGWFVDRRAKPTMIVFNGTRPEKAFGGQHRHLLDEQTVQRVAHQLDQRCRDVEPTSGGGTRTVGDSRKRRRGLLKNQSPAHQATD